MVEERVVFLVESLRVVMNGNLRAVNGISIHLLRGKRVSYNRSLYQSDPIQFSSQ